MLVSECPACHKMTAYAGNTAYCPHCGWNRDYAVSCLRMSMNAIPIGVFMFGAMAAFAYWGMKFNRAPQLMLFILFPMAVIPFNYFYTKRKIARLKAMQFPAGSPSIPSNFGVTVGSTMLAANSPESASAKPTFAPSAQYAALLTLPAPRQIRLAKSSVLAPIVVVVSIGAVFAIIAVNVYQDWARTQSLAGLSGKDWKMAGVALLLLLVPYGYWRSQKRECDLLEHGEVVMGNILRQWTDNKRNSSVEYEFTDFLGQTHKGSGFDYTHKLYPCMPVPVFYDRDNPKRYIAYCAAMHEVIPPAPITPSTEELVTKR